ncbi:MAG: hypothetical protein IT450_20275 [Phycisphaerales bacterium]|nr:hypothetical protein [Phycisphaerales bacterium]
MCYFITLVVGGADAGSIDPILRRHGRQATPVRNASLARVLAEGERQYLTCADQCDCGSALVPGESTSARRNPRAATLQKRAARLSRKGWSQAKIDRWVSEHVQADAWSERQRHTKRADTLKMWTAIITDLVALPGVERAGLLLHQYSGSVDEEILNPLRETVSIKDFESRLRNLREDQLLMAARPATRPG